MTCIYRQQRLEYKKASLKPAVKSFGKGRILNETSGRGGTNDEKKASVTIFGLMYANDCLANDSDGDRRRRRGEC